jgi:hypothetical protein
MHSLGNLTIFRGLELPAQNNDVRHDNLISARSNCKALSARSDDRYSLRRPHIRSDNGARWRLRVPARMAPSALIEPYANKLNTFEHFSSKCAGGKLDLTLNCKASPIRHVSNAGDIPFLTASVGRFSVAAGVKHPSVRHDASRGNTIFSVVAFDVFDCHRCDRSPLQLSGYFAFEIDLRSRL